MTLRKMVILAGLLLSPTLWAEEAVFRGLEDLQGSWKLSDPADKDQEAFRLSYRFISRNTTLVEDYGDPAKQITETLYHADGENLMATHYCARGNQPRLLLQTDTADNTLVFNFHDITNLADQNDPHMVGMKFTFVDKNHFEKEETYLVNGEPHVSTMSLVRAD